MKRILIFLISPIICLGFSNAHAEDWPLSRYPMISIGHEINQSYNCNVGGYRHGGERCSLQQIDKPGFVISQIGLFGARYGAHQGIDIIADKGTTVRSVGWLDLQRGDVIVSPTNRCAEGDAQDAGIRYSWVQDWLQQYEYYYWHLDCIPQDIHKKFFPPAPKPGEEPVEPEDVIYLWTGDDIGTVGETGNADAPDTPNGPHLHFGVKQNNAWINPLPLLDDYAPPDIKFNYIISNFSAADANIFSQQNFKINNLSSYNPVYAKTFAKFGIETSDDAIVKKGNYSGGHTSASGVAFSI